jgi:mannose-6-phosphate isomerase-like protein (cupin superfamily)
MINETLCQNPISPVAYTGQNKGQLGYSGYCDPVKINKHWGYELIYQNHELYCCKTLFIYPNKSCSYHLHMEKHETLLVVEGTLYIDTTHNKETKTYIVGPGEAFVVAPGFIHSLRAQNEAVTLVETSTPSFDTDSIRMADGK